MAELRAWQAVDHARARGPGASWCLGGGPAPDEAFWGRPWNLRERRPGEKAARLEQPLCYVVREGELPELCP
eukprot:6506135-Pyramimonas_sp.AAC.1